jgi:hypothetical protein
MGKITEIKFVGQPIFKQILDLTDRINIQGIVKKHDADGHTENSHDKKGFLSGNIPDHDSFDQFAGCV